MTRDERSWRSVRRSLLDHRQMEADIDDEVAFHLEGRIDALTEEGFPEQEARAEALRRFGDESRIKAEMRAESTKRIQRKRRAITMDSIVRDLRYAIRQITRHPGFSALLVLTIALAIGGNVAIFSALEGVVLRPLPYQDAQQLVAVWETPEGEGWHQPFTAPDYLDVREQASSFQDIGVITNGLYNLSGDTDPIRVRAGRCTASLLNLLGVGPLHGRLFSAEAEFEGNHQVVILSHGLWQEHFGGDEAIVGRSVWIDGVPWEIIGVMPESFRSPTPWGGKDMDRMWVPLVLPRDGSTRSQHWLGTVARLAPGVSGEEAEAELQVIAAQLSEAYPDSNARTRMFLEPMMARTLGGVSSALVFLLVVVGLVLLVACANVASMLLARGMNRVSEFALRASLGAGRKGLIGQLVTESLALAICGGAAGILMAFWGVDTLKAIMPESIPRGQLIEVNGAVLLFATAVTVTTGLLVGLAPALLATRTHLAEVVKHGRASRGGNRNRLLTAMVVAQLAVGFVLVNAAAVMWVSYANVMNQTNNFATEEVLLTQLPLSGPTYRPLEARKAFYDQLLERARALPGVRHAGLTSKLPLRGGSNSHVLVRDQVYDPTAQSPLVEFTFIGEGYLQAMGIPLLAGRPFDSQDMDVAADEAEEEDGTVEVPVVINKVRGRQEYFRAEVIGVVEDVRQWGPESDAIPEMFFPYTSEIWGDADMILTVLADGDPVGLTPPIRQVIRSLDAGLPVPAPYTMERVLEQTTAGRRFSTLLIGLFAVTALVLIIAGTYGVVSYAVSQRVHEVGVRMTLGANKARVAGLFMKRLGVMIVPGLGIGLLGAWASTRLTGSFVFGVSPLSPLHMVAAGGVMVLVALAATAVPVIRATHVDPQEALRVE